MFRCRLNPFKNQHIKVLFSYHVTVFFFSARLSNIESHLYLTVIPRPILFGLARVVVEMVLILRVRAGGADDDDEEDEDDDDREDNGDAFGDKFAMYPQ